MYYLNNNDAAVVYVFKPVNTLIDAFATKTQQKSSITVQCVPILSCLGLK